LADHPSDGVARFHLSHGPLAQQLGLVAEALANQDDNRQRAVRASEDLRQQLSVEGFGRAIEILARTLAPFCTRRELGRLQQLVQQAYNYEDQVSDFHMKLRPSRFVEHIRIEFRARDNSSAQVRVMTIHQAKGLEFDAVVLPMIYYGGGWFTHQNEFVVGRPRPTDPIELTCRYLKENAQALLPPEFQAAFDEARRQEVREGLSLLYVALTRAIRAVHVIMSFSAKRDQSSGEAVLLATLCPNGSDKLRKPGTLYEVGDRNWIQRDVPHALSRQREDNLEQFYLPDDAVLDSSAKPLPPRTNRGIPINSPSRLPGGKNIRLKSVFDAVDNSEILRRGTLIHGCFQLVGWLDESTPDRSHLVKHLRRIDQSFNDVDRLIDQFREMLKAPGIVKFFSRHAYQSNFSPRLAGHHETLLDALRFEVQTERRFAVRLENELLYGSIDRLITVYEGDRPVAADVIDLKTDQVSIENLSERIEHYRPQLDAYRRAVCKFEGIPLERISSRLVFLDVGEVVTLEPSSDSSGATEVQESVRGLGTQSEQSTINERVKAPNYKNSTQKRLWAD
jgi:ATP-dependent exoDNAse (exonuclease V) beta subunit